MRIEARLAWVALTTIMVLGAFVPSPFDTASPRDGVAAPAAIDEPVVSRPAGRPRRPATGDATPPSTDPAPRAGQRPAPRPGLRRTTPRRRSYDAVLVAAHLAPGTIEPAALRRFWREAADRGAPDEAIDALLAVARARAEEPALAHAALDYREDLVRLREDAEDRWATALDEEASARPPDAPEIAGDGDLALRNTGVAEASGHTPLADDELDEMAHVLRYSSDADAVGRVVETLALERDARVAAMLADAIDLPSAGHRLTVVDALWRTAADGRSAEGVRDALRSARYDAEPRVAARADRAIRDLDRLDRAVAARSASLTATTGPPAGGCPAEVCAGPGSPL